MNAPTASPPAPVFAAEKMPSKRTRVVVSIASAFCVVLVHSALGATFAQWAELLSRLPFDAAFHLLFVLVILLPLQFGFTRLQGRFPISHGYRRFGYWLATSLIGVAAATFLRFQAPSNTESADALTTLVWGIGLGLSMLFGAAAWGRFNN